MSDSSTQLTHTSVLHPRNGEYEVNHVRALCVCKLVSLLWPEKKKASLQLQHRHISWNQPTKYTRHD